LLTVAGCSNDPTFVSSTGVDTVTCGSSSYPCRSLSQGVENLLDWNDRVAEMNVAAGDYTDTQLIVHSITLTVSTNSANKPVLSLVVPPTGVGWLWGGEGRVDGELFFF
jgi:hypothetical protein